ncbi:retrovirus-related pol polyprotein from transposon TNT 1-94 [Tanacetum coccineum]
MIIETIHVGFDELTSMASEQFSSRPGPKLLTPGTISSGLVLNIPSSTLYVLPAKNDWEILFQPMFDVYLNSPPRVDPQVPAVIAPERAVSNGTPSSMTIDQDAPSTSTSQTPPETPSPVIPLGFEEADHDIKVVHMDNNPFVKFPIPEPSSEESSTQIVILNHVHSINQPPEHINKWTKDHPIDNVIGNPSRPVSTRQQLQDEALLCYFDAFLSSVEPKSYKDALTESCWIKAMQEELNEFERLKLWELVPRPDCVMVITLKWIYKGETLYEYYWRFSHLINDMHTIRMTMQQVQVNTKFLNALPSEWSKFVSDVKLAKSLYTTNYDQLYAYRSQHERHANEVCITRERYSDPLALVANSPTIYNPSRSPQHSGSLMYPPLQQFTPVYAAPIHHQYHHTPVSPQQHSISPQTFIPPLVTQQSRAEFPQFDSSRVVPINRGIATTSKGNYATGQPRVVKCYNYQGEGYMARQCTQPKRPRNDGWFKEKLMLAEAQEAGQILDEEQLAFLADPGISEALVAQQTIP